MPELYTFDLFRKYPVLLHGVTTKSQEHPYHFSLALHTGEHPQDIIANRNTLSRMLGSVSPLTYIVANQTHSDHISIITEKKSKGWDNIKDAVEDCDALITDTKGIMLTILTADCVPILLYDTKKKVIAAIHAGWRGTQKRITQKTVHQMVQTYYCNPKDIIAGIAPAIGRCCYEVGKEVAQHFFDVPKSFTVKNNKYMLDLPYLNKQQLLEAGVQETNIEMSGVCTACKKNRFFSYRKDDCCTGRFMSLIGMEA
jgi:YfiH family protein